MFFTTPMISLCVIVVVRFLSIGSAVPAPEPGPQNYMSAACCQTEITYSVTEETLFDSPAVWAGGQCCKFGTGWVQPFCECRAYCWRSGHDWWRFKSWSIIAFVLNAWNTFFALIEFSYSSLYRISTFSLREAAKSKNPYTYNARQHIWGFKRIHS